MDELAGTVSHQIFGEENHHDVVIGFEKAALLLEQQHRLAEAIAMDAVVQTLPVGPKFSKMVGNGLSVIDLLTKGERIPKNGDASGAFGSAGSNLLR